MKTPHGPHHVSGGPVYKIPQPPAKKNVASDTGKFFALAAIALGEKKRKTGERKPAAWKNAS
jgi:hypothetical protein